MTALPLWAQIDGVASFMWLYAAWRLSIALEDRLFFRPYLAAGLSPRPGPLYDEKRLIRSLGELGTPNMAKRSRAMSEPLSDADLDRRRRLARRVHLCWPFAAAGGLLLIGMVSLRFFG
jgi:hypothetical protein